MRQEQQPEGAQIHHRRDTVGGRERRAAKQRQRKHRLYGGVFRAQEPGQREHRDNDGDDRGGVDPGVASLDDGKRRGGQREGTQHHAGPI